MIQLRLILLGVTVIASVGYAIYNHYQNQHHERTNQHSYGPGQGSTGTTNEDYFLPPQPSTSITSGAEEEKRAKKRKKVITESVCSICLGFVVNSSANCKTLDCGHDFHKNCIEMWLTSKKTCPNCRKLVS